MDQYTRTVSDVYQDVFDEGSFIGKGIYDVDAFERALKGRFPANAILSHDLLEGCYARAGLLSDAELQEEHPDALQRRRRPPPALDTRRLATGRDGCGGASGARMEVVSAIRFRCCRSGKFSTTCGAAWFPPP